MFNNPYYNPYPYSFQENQWQNYGKTMAKTNFDFNGKWVNSIDEVNQINNENLPIISMDRNQNKFYMRIGNDLKAYEYKEVEIPNKDKEIEGLKAQLQELSNQLQLFTNQNANVAQMAQNKPKKVGAGNE